MFLLLTNHSTHRAMYIRTDFSVMRLLLGGFGMRHVFYVVVEMILIALLLLIPSITTAILFTYYHSILSLFGGKLCAHAMLKCGWVSRGYVTRRDSVCII